MKNGSGILPKQGGPHCSCGKSEKRRIFDRSFFLYAWTGAVFTVLNVFLLWLFIDVLEIHTVISSIVVVGGQFITRFLVYRWLDIM